MRSNLLTVPVWVSAVAFGILGFVLYLLLGRFVLDNSWTASLIGCAIGGLLLGLGTVLMVHRRLRAVRAVAGDVPVERLAEIERAAQRGPIPSDPEVRRTAAQLARRYVGQSRRAQWFIVVAALFTAASAVLQMLDHHTMLAGFYLVVLLFLAYLPFERQRLRKRLVKLTTPDDQPSAAQAS